MARTSAMIGRQIGRDVHDVAAPAQRGGERVANLFGGGGQPRRQIHPVGHAAAHEARFDGHDVHAGRGQPAQRSAASRWGRGGRDDEPNDLRDDGRRYGLQRVCRTWERSRSALYARRARVQHPARADGPRRRGPTPALSDTQLLAAVRNDLARSPFQGEGHRKVHARLRIVDGVRVRVLRVMRAQACSRLTAGGRVSRSRTTARLAPRDGHQPFLRSACRALRAGLRPGCRSCSARNGTSTCPAPSGSWTSSDLWNS